MNGKVSLFHSLSPILLFWWFFFSHAPLLDANALASGYTDGARKRQRRRLPPPKKRAKRKHEKREIGINRREKSRRSLLLAGTFPSQFRVQSRVSHTFIRSFVFHILNQLILILLRIMQCAGCWSWSEMHERKRKKWKFPEIYSLMWRTAEHRNAGMYTRVKINSKTEKTRQNVMRISCETV